MSRLHFTNINLSAIARISALVFLYLIGQFAVADDSLDSAYNPDVTGGNRVVCSERQADGKILIGGQFDAVGGDPQANLARLFGNGTLDTLFSPSVMGTPQAIIEQPDGKIIVAGAITNVNSASRNNIARLNSNGSLDTGFNPNVDGFSIFAAALQDDDKILIGGSFDTVGGVARSSIARLNSNGSLDTGFNPSLVSSIGEQVFSIAIQDDDKILIGGVFESVNGVTRTGVARLNPNGTLDTGFNPDLNSGIPGLIPSVQNFVVQNDGRIVLSGDFSNVAGVARKNIARLNSNGTLSSGFNVSINGSIVATVTQRDEKILIGGAFDTINSLNRNKIARFNSNGTLDLSFNPHVDDTVATIISLLPDLNIIGGSFRNVNGVSRNYLARLIKSDEDDLCVPIKTSSARVATVCL